MASILNDTKKILGLGADYEAFDHDIITHINAAFSVVNQLGLGPDEGFFIDDDTDEWEDIGLPEKWMRMLQTYVYLKVRSLFDPPATSFMIEQQKEQLKEYEWRLRHFKDVPEVY